MEIRYELTLDDSVAMAMYYRRHSGEMRRSMVAGAVAGVGLGIIVGVLVGHPYWILAAIASLIYLVMLWHAFNEGYRRKVQKLLAEGRNLHQLGSILLRLHPRYLETSSPFFASKIRWDMVDRIGQTDEHIFMFFGAAHGVTIPKRCFQPPESSETFFQTAIDYKSQCARENPDLSAPPPWETVD